MKLQNVLDELKKLTAVELQQTAFVYPPNSCPATQQVPITELRVENVEGFTKVLLLTGKESLSVRVSSSDPPYPTSSVTNVGDLVNFLNGPNINQAIPVFASLQPELSTEWLVEGVRLDYSRILLNCRRSHQ